MSDRIIIFKEVALTLQTQIRVLIVKQSGQALHCLLFHLHHLEISHHGITS